MPQYQDRSSGEIVTLYSICEADETVVILYADGSTDDVDIEDFRDAYRRVR